PRSLYILFSTAPATTQIYTLSLHDALPIYEGQDTGRVGSRDHGNGDDGDRAGLVHELLHSRPRRIQRGVRNEQHRAALKHPFDRSEEQRLNSSHVKISYAVFCLKKKKKYKK